MVAQLHWPANSYTKQDYRAAHYTQLTGKFCMSNYEFVVRIKTRDFEVLRQSATFSPFFATRTNKIFWLRLLRDEDFRFEEDLNFFNRESNSSGQTFPTGLFLNRKLSSLLMVFYNSLRKYPVRLFILDIFLFHILQFFQKKD